MTCRIVLYFIWAFIVCISTRLGVYRIQRIKEVLYSYFQIQQSCTEKREVLFDFSLTVKAAPHECVIGTGQP